MNKDKFYYSGVCDITLKRSNGSPDFGTHVRPSLVFPNGEHYCVLIVSRDLKPMFVGEKSDVWLGFYAEEVRAEVRTYQLTMGTWDFGSIEIQTIYSGESLPFPVSEN